MIGQIIGIILTLTLVFMAYMSAREHERGKTLRRVLNLMDKARKREGVPSVTCLEILDEFEIKE